MGGAGILASFSPYIGNPEDVDKLTVTCAWQQARGQLTSVDVSLHYCAVFTEAPSQ